jgi:hypothetical protein
MAVSIFDASTPAARGPGAPSGNETRTIGVQYVTVTRETSSPRTDLSGLTTGIVATLAKGDKLFIQNLNSVGPLKIKKGASASATSFDYVLPACSSDDDGTGGVIEITDFEGSVSVFATDGYRFAWHKSAA